MRVNVRADALTPALSHREREKTNLTNTFSSVASVPCLPGRPARRVWDNALSSPFAPHDTPLSRRPQITRDLQRPLGRGKQLQHQRHAPLGDRRIGGLTKHLLHSHRQRGRVIFMITNGDPASRRHSVMRRQFTIQTLLHSPIK